MTAEEKQAFLPREQRLQEARSRRADNLATLLRATEAATAAAQRIAEEDALIEELASLRDEDYTDLRTARTLLEVQSPSSPSAGEPPADVFVALADIRGDVGVVAPKGASFSVVRLSGPDALIDPGDSQKRAFVPAVQPCRRVPLVDLRTLSEGTEVEFLASANWGPRFVGAIAPGFRCSILNPASDDREGTLVGFGKQAGWITPWQPVRVVSEPRKLND